MIRGVVALMGILLGGCATLPAAPPIAAAGTAFDGEYAGQDTLISGGGGYVCGADSLALRLSVRDGRFDYPFLVSPPRTAPLPVQVAADGTFAGQMLYGLQDYTPLYRYMNAWATVRGHIAGGTLEATVIDDRCTRRVTAQLG